MLGKVFKAYDVRATYPKPLNEKLAWQIGYGAARYMTEIAADAGHDDPMMRHVVVGRDMRTSSPALSEALMQGIMDFGAHVIDVGLVDTPFISFAINYLGCCGGIQTTLKDGVEKVLLKEIPELKRVADITDHAAGANPYYK